MAVEPGRVTGPPEGPRYSFGSAEQAAERLRAVGYLPDDRTSTVVHLADRLGKPVLVEGPAGTGKTQLAKSVALARSARLIRLQCYEGLDESRALFEWDYRRQLLHLEAARGTAVVAELESELFDESFLLTRPLLAAIRAQDDVVLLVDEVDRLDVETEALLLEVLSEYQVSIPELGTLTATRIPTVYLTSNNSRELSEALKRRCLFLPLGYPSPEREQEIIASQVPELNQALAASLTAVVHSLRRLDLRKPPSVAETLDWARSLLVLGADALTPEVIAETLPVLLKHEADMEVAGRTLLGSA